MRDELDDHPEYYPSLTYEYWCDLLSIIEVKDERKRTGVHIKKISSSSTASLSNINESVRIPRRKKSKTGVLIPNNSPRRTHDRHHSTQRYCVLFKKAEIPERNYASHIAKDCTSVRTKCSIKDGMGGLIGSRTHAVQQHKNPSKSKSSATPSAFVRCMT